MRTICSPRRWASWAELMMMVMLVGGASCRGEAGLDGPSRAGDGAGAELEFVAESYVGATACADCHAEEFAAWRGSHHDLAMQHLRTETGSDNVLGDFDDVEFRHGGVTSRFFRDSDRYMVRTDGSDGKLTDFEVAFVFGVEPLQQYLVELDGGRLQVLPMAWDTRAKGVGGQRWFHLYPDEVLQGDDPLHWTGVNQNWNTMCAACHSTGLVKGYSFDARAYATAFQEINVACEACHGPGRDHVELARSGRAGGLDPAANRYRSPSEWQFGPGAEIAHRVGGAEPDPMVDACGVCHANRLDFFENPVHTHSLLDTHRPQLLVEPFYFVDGQIREEVYVWGSFVQSKMYAAGVGCSDCHNPHSLELRAEGNALCVRCHSGAVFDVGSHHHHAVGTPGASCVACHMPERTYMGVDGRRDHSMRVPRPDLSTALDTPDACSGCHTDRSSSWAAAALTNWEVRPGPHFGEVFHAARLGSPAAHRGLLEIAADGEQSSIVRATALAELPRVGDPLAARPWLEDSDPLVRLGAVQSISAVSPPAAAEMLAPLLKDPVRAIRIEVVQAIAGTSAEQQEGFALALRDFTESRDANADRAWAHMSIGILSAQRQDVRLAAKAYESAIQIEPGLVPPYANLADLFATQGDSEASELVLRAGIDRVQDRPPLYHALGLLLVREQRPAEALEMLELAWSLRRVDPRFAYALAVALHSFEDPRAGTMIPAIAAEHPNHAGLQQVRASYR